MRIGAITPDPRAHIPTTSREEAPRRARRHRDDRILVTLEHHLRDTGIRVPELHASILGATHDPFAVRGKADAEHVILEVLKQSWVSQLENGSW
jgi:hypothetical protein